MLLYETGIKIEVYFKIILVFGLHLIYYLEIGHSEK